MSDFENGILERPGKSGSARPQRGMEVGSMMMFSLEFLLLKFRADISE